MIKVEDAISNLKNQILRFAEGTEPNIALKLAIETLQGRRTSKWNLTEIHNCYEIYQCDKCKRTITVFHRYGYSLTTAQVAEDYPYCHCGAKMEADE